MERHEIIDKLEAIEDECFKRNKGSNEAELEFKEEIADWIYALEHRPPKEKAKSTKCPNCGVVHPLVAEFGYCGKCAQQIYGNE